ncbi:hypothetical protein JCM3765_000211 [Sporobolomyces pararoseus]
MQQSNITTTEGEEEDAFQVPTTRRLSFTTTTPFNSNSNSNSHSTTTTTPTIEDTTIAQQEEEEASWKEPEIGFENIQLNEDQQSQAPPLPPPPSSIRRGSNVSITTPTTGTPTSTTSRDDTSTELAPSSLPSPTTSSLAPPLPPPTTTSTTTSPPPSSEQPEPEGGGSISSRMSLPPDPSKIEQSSPTKKSSSNSSAPSVMQKIISMTRQRDLPPKNKEEEEKHLKQLEQMLAASKEIEKKRKIEKEEKLKLKNQFLQNSFQTWETLILPNWRIVLHDTSQGKQLKDLWWKGTMPVRFRGRLYSLCIGNSLAISKNHFSNCLERAKKGLEQGNSEKLIKFKLDAEEEMENVLKGLKLFQKKGGVMHQDLLDLLLAWSVHDQDRGVLDYPQGLAYPASLLLVNQPAPEAFISLLNLISKSFLSSFYSPPGNSMESLNSYERVFDTLLADSMPKIYSNFSSQLFRPSIYLLPWLSSLFLKFLPLDLTTRLFDIFLLEGDSFVFRICLVLLKILEPRLFNPDLKELELVFKGKDQGAVAIVKREKGLLSTPGTMTTTTTTTTTTREAEEEEEGENGVEVEEVYTEMGCTEERVFEELENLEWKEETWERLVERELPDA